MGDQKKEKTRARMEWRAGTEITLSKNLQSHEKGTEQKRRKRGLGRRLFGSPNCTPGGKRGKKQKKEGGVEVSGRRYGDGKESGGGRSGRREIASYGEDERETEEGKLD